MNEDFRNHEVIPYYQAKKCPECKEGDIDVRVVNKSGVMKAVYIINPTFDYSCNKCGHIAALEEDALPGIRYYRTGREIITNGKQ